MSNLSWSTNQHKAWVKEAESEQAHHKALPRVHLLLIGYLRAGRAGELRLTDASGDVTCEVSTHNVCIVSLVMCGSVSMETCG